MENNRYYFNVYGDMVCGVQSIIDDLGISGKNNAVWDVMNMISLGLHKDWVLWLLQNEPYLADVAQFDSFEEIPRDLQQQVLKSLRSYNELSDFLRIFDKEGNLTWQWEKPEESNLSDTEFYHGEVPVDSDYIEKANKSGCRIIFSNCGYTESAKALAHKYWINLEEAGCF